MKIFYENPQIGKSRHSISYYDGKSTHNDSSPFIGIITFSNIREKKKEINKLLSEGYKKGCFNDVMSFYKKKHEIRREKSLYYIETDLPKNSPLTIFLLAISWAYALISFIFLFIINNSQFDTTNFCLK